MSDEILKHLQGRRSFLKGSALLAVSALVAPAALSAQQSRDPQEPRSQSEAKDNQGRDGQDGGRETQDGQDKTKDDKAPAQTAKEGDGAQTFVGADGRPYRVCP